MPEQAGDHPGVRDPAGGRADAGPPHATAYDLLARVAAGVLGARDALVHVPDGERLRIVGATPGAASRADRVEPFCRRAIAGRAPIVLAASGAAGGALAAVPMVRGDPGDVVGALCVLDADGRPWTASAVDRLRDLAALGAALAADAGDAGPAAAAEGAHAAVHAAPSAGGAADAGAAEPTSPFRQMVESVDDVFWLADPATDEILYVSPAFEQLWGVAASVYVADPSVVVPLIHPDDRAAALVAFNDTRRDLRAEYTYRIVRPDGVVRWVQNRSFPVYDATGRVWRRAGLAADVTARKEAELALRESEARYRAVVEQAADLIFLFAADGRVLDANRAACESVGRTRDELLGGTIADIATTRSLDEIRRMFARVVAGESLTIEGENRRADGTTLPVEIRLGPVHAGGETRVLAVARDQTERRTAEAALRESEARFRQIADHVGEMFWLVELGPTLEQSRVLYVNAAYERITGRAGAALRTAPSLGLEHIVAEDLPHVLEAAHAVAAGASRTAEYRLQTNDGPQRIVRSRMTPVRDAAGRVARIVGFTEDVTEHRALEAQLRQAQKMEAIGQLAGGVAHDFNNLLTVISGNLQFLRDDLSDDLPAEHPARADLGEIALATQRARALVRQLLLFSRRQPARHQLLRVSDVVRDAEQLLRRVIGEEITLTTVVDGAEDALVRADPGQLEQMLMNLAVNARDAMLTPRHGHPGTGGALEIDVDTVTLGTGEARAWGDIAPGRWVRLRVRDTGHGMDAETRAHIFEPFFTTKDVGSGTGLGLATVFGIVRQAGGAVRVDSAPGSGTTFTILLPAADAAAALPGAASASAAASAAVSAGAPARAVPAAVPRPATVLLVEDETALRVTARRILERSGCTVLEARHGVDALLVWRARTHAIDVVVTDLRMPEMGGRELVAVLRADAPSLPVVFVSGYADRSALDEAAAGDAPASAAYEAFVEKPFTSEALLDAVSRALTATAGPPPVDEGA